MWWTKSLRCLRASGPGASEGLAYDSTVKSGRLWSLVKVPRWTLICHVRGEIAKM
jgi:hypothetical protein